MVVPGFDYVEVKYYVASSISVPTKCYPVANKLLLKCHGPTSTTVYGTNTGAVEVPFECDGSGIVIT